MVKKNTMKRFIPLVASLLLVATAVTGFWLLNRQKPAPADNPPSHHTDPGTAPLPLSISAETLGMEEYTFGISLPNFIYGDDSVAILCDTRGIYVYDWEKESLVGYADFRPLEMTTIQGETATALEISSDGRFVKFYEVSLGGPTGRKQYLYDVKQNRTQAVDDYSGVEGEFFPCSFFHRTLDDCSLDHSHLVEGLSSDDPHSFGKAVFSYKVRDGFYVGIYLDVPENGPIQYKHLRLIRELDGERREFVVFQ